MPGIYSRQTVVQGNDGNLYYVDDGEQSFWWTGTGQIVRWSIFLGILFLITAFLIGAHWHAKKRIRNNLPPLAYHRWLLTRRQRARYDPGYQNSSVYYHPPTGGYYHMNGPPPMYDPNTQRPPVYHPPAGGTKVHPEQGGPAEPVNRSADATDSTPHYEPPPGPPPAAVVPADRTV